MNDNKNIMALKIKNQSFLEISEIVGQTPFYVYDRQKITSTINSLKKILPDSILLYYAIKANPMQAIIDLMSTQVNGFDVSSLKELHQAVNTGVKSRFISFAGPAKSTTELLSAIRLGVVINVESFTELESIITIAIEKQLSPNICLRINPDFALKRSGVSMTGYASAFGIDTSQLPEAFALLKKSNIPLYGFHIYSGSQNLSEQALSESHNEIFNLVDQLSTDYNLSIQHLNIGGGFGIPYFKGEKSLEIKPIAKNLESLIERFTNQYDQVDIVIELGRYLVGEAGYYACKIVDIKSSKDKKIVVTDGGLHHHLSNSGNFGQVIRKNYPVFIEKTPQNSSIIKTEDKENTKEQEVVTVVGPLCTPLDLLAKDIALDKAQIGDIFVVKQSGAYGKSASPEAFLGHNAVKEILL